MQIENLSWFPGHMTKTKRMIVAEIGHMDAVCEIVDARIPLSSRNPDVDEMTAGRSARLIVLNRVDQADPRETKRWAAYLPRKRLRRARGQCQGRRRDDAVRRGCARAVA